MFSKVEYFDVSHKKQLLVIAIDYFLLILLDLFLSYFLYTIDKLDAYGFVEKNITESTLLIYFIIFPLILRGRTVAMYIFRIIIVDKNYEEVGFIKNIIRSLFMFVIYVLSAWPIFFGLLKKKNWPFDILFGCRMVTINKTD